MTELSFLSRYTRMQLDLLYPDFRARVIRIYKAVFDATGRKLNATETLRSFERQQKLYEIGRIFKDGKWVIANPEKRETLTNAPPGRSYHSYGLAVDSAWAGADPYLKLCAPNLRKELWSVYGAAIAAEGCVWGGDWDGDGLKDPNDFDLPHCERSYGFNTQNFLTLYSEGGLSAVWSRLDYLRGVPEGTEWQKR